MKKFLALLTLVFAAQFFAPQVVTLDLPTADAAKFMPIKAASGGGGGGCGTISTSVVAARTSGVAPLYVHLDATGTTDSAVTTPFLDARYLWNYGDPQGAAWAYGSNPSGNNKNAGTGPIGGHVFETPGTYNVTVQVYDGTNTCTSTPVVITVTDPDVVFAANTVCIGNSVLPVAGSNGCPSGAAAVQSSDADATCASQLAAGKRRLLFRANDTFNIAGGRCDVTVTGPGLIGSFGTGTKPLFLASGQTNPGAFNFGGQNFPNSSSNLKDWRLMDVEIRGNNNSELISAQGGFNQLTYLRITGSECDDACIMFNGDLLAFYNSNGHATHSLWSEIAIVDSSIGHPQSWTLYAFLNKFFVTGNLIDNQSVGSHVYRMPFASNGVISNNDIVNNGLGSAGTHTLKIHSISFAGNSVVPAGTYSENNVISDNKFQAGNFTSNQWTIAFSPQDDTENERLRNFIFERNWVGAGTNTIFGMEIQVVNMHIRNNVYNSSGSTAGQGTALNLSRRSSAAGAPGNISILNNSLYTSANNLNASDQPGFDVEASVTAGTVIKNNLVYAPASSGALAVRCSSTCTTSNNTSTVVTNPNFTATPPTTVLSTWKPTSGYAVGGGTSVLNWYDILGVGWQPTWDIGAVKH